MATAQDYDETARLVLMEFPNATFMEFHRFLEGLYGRNATLVASQAAYQKYRGWDGRVGATHDLWTGLPRSYGKEPL